MIPYIAQLQALINNGSRDNSCSLLDCTLGVTIRTSIFTKQLFHTIIEIIVGMDFKTKIDTDAIHLNHIHNCSITQPERIDVIAAN